MGATLVGTTRRMRGAGSSVSSTRPRCCTPASEALAPLRELLSPQGGVTYLYRKFKVEPLSADRLASIAWGERLDPRRHRLYRNVMTLTPHDALVSESSEGWIARVVFEE